MGIAAADSAGTRGADFDFDDSEGSTPTSRNGSSAVAPETHVAPKVTSAARVIVNAEEGAGEKFPEELRLIASSSTISDAAGSPLDGSDTETPSAALHATLLKSPAPSCNTKS